MRQAKVRSGEGDIFSAVAVGDYVECFPDREIVIPNHLSQRLSGGNSIDVFVTAGAPVKELGAVFYTASSKRRVRVTEEGIVRPPTAVALPIKNLE